MGLPMNASKEVHLKENNSPTRLSHGYIKKNNVTEFQLRSTMIAGEALGVFLLHLELLLPLNKLENG
jgi:hypothetical protein